MKPSLLQSCIKSYENRHSIYEMQLCNGHTIGQTDQTTTGEWRIGKHFGNLTKKNLIIQLNCDLPVRNVSYSLEQS